MKNQENNLPKHHVFKFIELSNSYILGKISTTELSF